MLERIYISSGGEFCDENGNAIQLRGVNLDPIVKIPASPFQSTHESIKNTRFFEDADKVSFINHPLPLNEVESHINRLKSLGFNCIRFPFTWESLEHGGPGDYDLEYMDYFIEVLQKINGIGGVYVYLDPHQDVWSRFSGGSGAPLWTFYSAGFQPANFKETEAAIIQNYYTDSHAEYPKMLWPTNYFRLACQTMFTLFFAGKDFAPKCIINGMNIQDYLQNKFVDAVIFFYSRIRTKAPELFEQNCVIGLETINEPNGGYLGDQNINVIPKERSLKRGSTPTAFQSFILGEGYETLVDQYDISIFGPTKIGTKKVDPKGVSCWFTKAERDIIDSKYGWERNVDWLPDQCIWRLHGVWELTSSGPQLLKHDYFAHIPGQSSENIDDHYIINHQFVDYYRNYRNKFRALDKDLLLFMQPMIFKQPPELLGSDLLDDRTIYACHFYDGFSLMFKTWNRKFNVDTFGIVRGRYLNPAFSVVLGENNIRKSIKRQLKDMKQEVKTALNIPVYFTEIGMPFDMDDKKAYKDGDYSSQISALDALQCALESENLSYSLWCYCSKNSHEWGDQWNNEDFSIWSSQDITKRSEQFQSDSVRTETDAHTDNSEFIPLAFNSELTPPPSAPRGLVDLNGFRALDAILRPFPVKIHGNFINAEFNLVSRTYSLKISAKANSGLVPNSETYIFLPSRHFPLKDVTILASSGRFTFDPEYQVLKWYHDPGQQYITISLVDKKDNSPDCVIA